MNGDEVTSWANIEPVRLDKQEFARAAVAFTQSLEPKHEPYIDWDALIAAAPSYDPETGFYDPTH